MSGARTWWTGRWRWSLPSAAASCGRWRASAACSRWERIAAAIAAPIYYRAQTGLIMLENTHNMAGGTVTPVAVLEEVWAGAKERGLPVHLDGARIFNAAAALDVPVAALTRGFATVMFCLSKGLCAPVGSMLVGSRALIDRGRSIRKMLGGGMRQAGVLAAAALDCTWKRCRRGSTKITRMRDGWPSRSLESTTAGSILRRCRRTS